MARLQRQIAVEAVTLGQPITINLPRNYAYRSLSLRLAGSITVSGGSTSGTPFAAGCSKLISRVTIRRDGKDSIVDLTGEELHILNSYLYKSAVDQTNLANGDAATNQAVNTTLKVPFENLLGIKPFDTLLQSVGLSSLDMIIEINSAASAVIDGGDRTVAVGSTTFTLTVTSDEETGVANFNFGNIRLYKAQSVSPAGASSAYQIKPISVGNYYKGFLMITKVAATAGDLDSTLATNVKLQSGSETFINAKGLVIRGENKTALQLASLIAGVYYIDLMPDGRLNATLDVTPQSGRQSLELEIDVAKAGSIDVIALEYVPPVTVVKK
jgi:hypothetical protein